MTLLDQKRLSLDELQDLNEQFETATPEAIMRWANQRFGTKLALMSSFGLEDVAIFDMLWRINHDARVMTLDTLRLPTETYTVIDRTKSRYGVDVEIFTPDVQATTRMVRERGYNLFYASVGNRKLCCQLRKVEPLSRALTGLDAWLTGLRREQGMARDSIGIVEWDEAHQNYKINPLANWTLAQVREYVCSHSVPYNELHDRGYPSIGCAPCTRAVRSGEDVRAGRWWWESDPSAKECGLHVIEKAAP